MLWQISPNGSADGCFPAYADNRDISSLTCTIFDPSIFLRFSKSNFFHISPTRFKSSIKDVISRVLRTGAVKSGIYGIATSPLIDRLKKWLFKDEEVDEEEECTCAD